MLAFQWQLMVVVPPPPLYLFIHYRLCLIQLLSVQSRHLFGIDARLAWIRAPLDPIQALQKST